MKMYVAVMIRARKAVPPVDTPMIVGVLGLGFGGWGAEGAVVGGGLVVVVVVDSALLVGSWLGDFVVVAGDSRGDGWSDDVACDVSSASEGSAINGAVDVDTGSSDITIGIFCALVSAASVACVLLDDFAWAYGIHSCAMSVLFNSLPALLHSV
jgi:hypothetical protein